MDFSTAKIILGLDGNPAGVSVMTGDAHISIPFIEGNTDYQEYLKWLAEGNEPLPPDEPEGEA